MANGFTQYLRDTRAELRHVAWPTRTQTIVYALIVAAVSVGVALYLGFFDFLFTTGLKRVLQVLPQTTPSAQTTTASSTPIDAAHPTVTIPLNNLPKKAQ